MKAGDTLGGKYKLIERLGAGAMGVVWEAVNERMGRRFALKLINHPTDDLRQRLIREARACGSLNHPNIVEVYDIGETDEKDPFLVMQLLTGETLGEMLERKKRIEPYTLAARIGRDIASALDAAHSAKIIHRDLKPANIFMHREAGADESSFTVKVVDFGVSKSLAANDGPATVTGLVVGSPAYMSPEQVTMVKGLDHRTDIWSLGIILYELLTGVRPFGGKTVEDVVHQILSAPVSPVSNRVRSVPPALDELVARCLERDRNKRIQDAKSLARALASIAEVSYVSRVMVNVVSPPSSSPGRAAMGSTPDASPANAGRAAMGSNPDGSPSSGPGRAMMSAQTMAITDSMVTTMPLQRQGASGHPEARQGSSEARGGMQPPPEEIPVGTQVLSSSEPVASPMPAWRLEMQNAIEASRKAAETQGVSQPENLQQGGTLALPPEMIPGYTAAVGQAPEVITTTSPTVQPAVEGAIRGRPTSDAASRKRSKGVGAGLYAAVGVGIVSIGALVVVVALGPSSSEEKAMRPAAASSAHAERAEHAPAPKEIATAAPKETVIQAPAASTVAEAVPPATAAAARKATAEAPTVKTPPPVAPPGAAPLPRSPSPGKPPAEPTVKGPMPRPCSRFIKTNCYEPRPGLDRKLPF